MPVSDAADPAHSLQPPLLTRDYDFFVEGLKAGELRVQRCTQCQALRHPPMPMCPGCNSLDWSAQALAGTGKVYSFTVVHHPPMPPYSAPHPIVLAEMDEGVRVLAAFHGDPATLRIGMPVRVEFVEIAGGMRLHRFRAGTERA